MKVVLSFLPVIGCALMMAVCMGLIGVGRRRTPAAAQDEAPATAVEVAALREEVARLRAEQADGARSVDG